MWKYLIPVIAALALGVAADAATLFSDNFNDNLVANPTYSPTGAQWVTESGLLSAGSDNPTGFTFYNPQPGTLMFHSGATTTKASINFGSTVANTAVEVRFKIRQTNGSGVSYLVYWGFKNTASAKSIEQWASPNGGYFGTGGFNPGGLGSAYKLSASGWDYLKYIYNPSTGVVDVWLGTDGITYTKAATWTDTQGITSVDQFYFKSGGTISWMIDDVEIQSLPMVDEIVFSPDGGWYTTVQNVTISCPTPGATIRYTTDGTEPTETTGTVIASGSSVVVDRVMTLKAGAWASGYVPRGVKTAEYKVYTEPWVAKPSAVRTIYQNGVPHTDRNGNFRLTYDPASSFFPIGHYAAWVGTRYNQTWTFQSFANAGFNTAMMWPSPYTTLAEADAAASAGIQLILDVPSDDQVLAFKNHPALLAWRMYDEPTGIFWGNDMQGHYDAFLARKAQVKALGSNHPFFTLDCPWIMEPATSWWILWNTAGDVSSHDNYPIYDGTNTVSTVNGIPETVSLAVSVNNQNKPVWFVPQAFGTPYSYSGSYPWRIPTLAQERSMIYTSVIHGATGLIYFILDSYISRESQLLGMAPNPIADYGHPGGYVATLTELRAIKNLWYAVVGINSEINALRPAILSPTSTVPYEVSLSNTLPYVTETPIRTILKNHPSGGYVLLLANVDGAPQKSRIRFPNRQFTVQEMYGSLGFTKEADYIEMNNPAWDVRVFRIFDTQSIWDVKNWTGGTLSCSGIVSAVFTDYLYIENADRTIGIRVNKTAHGRSVGQVVDVIGTPQTLSTGERCIAADSVTATGSVGEIRPQAMRNKSLGGNANGLQAGVEGGVGINTIGLLIRTTGRVKTKGTGWFMIDDGSGVSVKVYGTVPSGTPYVTVTGASSCEKDGSNKIQRVILATGIQSL